MTHERRHARMAATSQSSDAAAESALRERLAALPAPAPADAALMQRLLAIPAASPRLLDRLAAALAEAGERFAAPRLLAGEAAALAGALALGLWLGAMAAMTATGAAESVDLSAYLLADLDGGPLDVGEGSP